MANRTRNLLDLIGRAANERDLAIEDWADEARKNGAQDDFVAAGRQIRASIESGLSNELVTAAIDRATNLVLYFL
jgi:hypothetical protein